MPLKRLHGPALVSLASATKYTCPAATRAIIRHIHVSNTTAGIVTFTLSIGADAAAVRLFDGYSIAAGAILDHFGLYVLAAAEIIAANAGTTNILTLTIDGEEELV